VYYTSYEGSLNIWNEVSTFLDFYLFVLLGDLNFDFFFAIRKYFNFVEFSKALLSLVTLWFSSAFSDMAVYKEAPMGLYVFAHSFFPLSNT